MTTESGIQYLRELAVVEVIYRSLDNNQASEDLGEVQCMWSTWQKFVWSTLSSYTCTLVLMIWPDIEGRWASRLQQFKENLSSTPTLKACVLAGERLSQQFQVFKDSVASSSPIPAIISATKWAQGEGYHGHICVPLCGSVCTTMRRTWGGRMVNPPGSWGMWIARKNSGQKGSIQENHCSSCCWATPRAE